jgi:glycosyltransferase involved in cell wall biosynthesis
MTRAVRAVERRLASRCDAIVAISAHERDAGLRIGIPAERVQLVRSGLAPWPAQHATTTESSDPWPARPGVRLLFVGRFDRQKAFDVFAAVARALPAANCVAIGDYSVDTPRDHALPTNMHMPGWQAPAAVHQWMTHASLLVMPSRWEGFGLTAVEAMRAGLPVIATRVGGLQEIVVEQRTGWLVMPDDVQAIVQLIQRSTLQQLRAFGAAGRARYAELFTAERMHRELLALYRHGLAQRAARPALPRSAAPGAVSISRR